MILNLILTAVIYTQPTSSLAGVVSVPPSQSWDGADGSWSTFAIRIGSPAQTVRLLPGTSATACNSIWAVLPAGCNDQYNANVSGCASSRGDLFLNNESTTWSTERLSNNGLYGLPDVVEASLGYTGSAYFGFDVVSLGFDGQDLPTLSQQIIAGFTTDSFWIGSLGLSPISLNFTNFNDPLPSLLSSLRTQGYINSSSWAYTAGAVYQTPSAFGSLTFGGFDIARYNSSAQLENLPFGTDASRDLLVNISSITYDTIGSLPLSTESIYVLIDSLVSVMYLPIPVCQAFEQAFNLTLDPVSGYYLLSPEQHDSLLAQNPTFTFTLSRGVDDGNGNNQSVDIRLPYAAFDLNLTQPYAKGSIRYFPLKQAQNESQYTLGRVFLQELYVIADYDRRQFTVAQAVFPPLPANLNLRAIEPPSNINVSSISLSRDNKSLPKNLIAGTTTSAVISLLLSAFSIWFCFRRRKIVNARLKISSRVIGTGSLNDLPIQGHELYEFESGDVVTELDNQEKNFCDAAMVVMNPMDGRVLLELKDSEDQTIHELPA